MANGPITFKINDTYPADPDQGKFEIKYFQGGEEIKSYTLNKFGFSKEQAVVFIKHDVAEYITVGDLSATLENLDSTFPIPNIQLNTKSKSVSTGIGSIFEEQNAIDNLPTFGNGPVGPDANSVPGVIAPKSTTGPTTQTPQGIVPFGLPWNRQLETSMDPLTPYLDPMNPKFGKAYEPGELLFGLNNPIDAAAQDKQENTMKVTKSLYYTRSPLGVVPFAEYIYPQSQGKKRGSLFSNVNTLTKREGLKDSSNHPLSFDKPEKVHTSDVYDISTVNIIQRLKDYPGLKLKYSDFIYCRDYGVYPNNRLVICRRFLGPISDDLFGKDVNPAQQTLVSWYAETDPAISLQFEEVWTPAEASFKSILNEFGKDIGFKTVQLGDVLSNAANVLPLPGVTEGLQRLVLSKIGRNPDGSGGLIDDSSKNVIPSGSPNLIKESQQRLLIREDQPGSSLKGKISMKVSCCWEQKFIAGVDPTLMYYDLLQTILSFGSSPAVFYLGKRSTLTKLPEFLKRFFSLDGLKGVVKDIIDAFNDALNSIKGQLREAIKPLIDSRDNSGGSSKPKNNETTEEREQRLKADIDNKITKAVNDTTNFIDKQLKLMFSKYRVIVIGVVASLTGAPAAPWHITVGNPLRPILCSGDMICSNSTINFGPQLSFNDLPSYVEFTFTMESQRNLGIDELMEKFSCGGLRFPIKDADNFWSTAVVETTSENGNESYVEGQDVWRVTTDPDYQEGGLTIIPNDFEFTVPAPDVETLIREQEEETPNSTREPQEVDNPQSENSEPQETEKKGWWKRNNPFRKRNKKETKAGQEDEKKEFNKDANSMTSLDKAWDATTQNYLKNNKFPLPPSLTQPLPIPVIVRNNGSVDNASKDAVDNQNNLVNSKNVEVTVKAGDTPWALVKKQLQTEGQTPSNKDIYDRTLSSIVKNAKCTESEAKGLFKNSKKLGKFFKVGKKWII